MLKVACVIILSGFLAACGGAPAPTLSNASPYSLISEQADPVASNLSLMIKVTGPATQTNVKSVVESIIDSRKSEYRQILVKSYTEGMSASDLPFAITRCENGAITHRFNSMAESQKIPTH